MPGDVVTMDSDLTLYPIWEANPEGVVITFDGNGNTDGLLPSKQIISAGETFYLPGRGILNREGYAFGGWFTDNNHEYAAGESVVINRDTTFYARWIKVCRITYDKSYNLWATVPVDNTIYLEGMTVTVKPYPGGSYFICWNTKPDGSGISYNPGDTFIITADITLYAIFSDLIFIDPNVPLVSIRQVSYNGNMAEGGNPPEVTQNVAVGSTVVVKDNTGNFYRDGYIFEGWNTRADGTGITYQPGDIITAGSEDITLYAIWRELLPDIASQTYTITYKSYGHIVGTVPTDSNGYKPGQTVILKDNIGNLKKDGHIFYGWLIDNKIYLPGDTFIMKNNAVTAYAIWAPVDISTDVFTTISFNGNGNTGGTVPNSINYSIKNGAVLPQNTGNLTRPGYAFGGWTDNINVYLPGQTYYMGNLAQNTTLYAVWLPTRTMSYDGNGNTGGDVPTEPVSYAMGENISILDNANNLIRDKHLFVGWFIKDRIYQPGESIAMGLENIVASAVWAPLNTIPNRKTGVDEAVTADVTVGDIYSLNLSDIFEDVDGDSLTYYVSVNGGVYELTNTFYEYQTTGIGSVTLVFKANDGMAESTDTYIVNLTINEVPVTNTILNRKDDIEEIVIADVTVGDIYSLNLSDIFEDTDGDCLIYFVSVNGSSYEEASVAYTYAATNVGNITLVFKANDGIADSTDTYTVTLNIRNNSSETKPSNTTPKKDTSTVTPSADSSGTDSEMKDNVPKYPSYQAVINSAENAEMQTEVIVQHAQATVELSPQLGIVIKDGEKVEIEMPSIADVSEYTVSVPVSYLKSEQENSGLILKTHYGDMEIPSNMLSNLTEEDMQHVQISTAYGDKAELPDKVKDAISDRPFVQLTLTLDGVKTEWNNPEAPVKIQIPYTPTASELEFTVGNIYTVSCIFIYFIFSISLDIAKASIPPNEFSEILFFSILL